MPRGSGANCETSSFAKENEVREMPRRLGMRRNRKRSTRKKSHRMFEFMVMNKLGSNRILHGRAHPKLVTRALSDPRVLPRGETWQYLRCSPQSINAPKYRSTAKKISPFSALVRSFHRAILGVAHVHLDRPVHILRSWTCSFNNPPKRLTTVKLSSFIFKIGFFTRQVQWRSSQTTRSNRASLKSCPTTPKRDRQRPSYQTSKMATNQTLMVSKRVCSVSAPLPVSGQRRLSGACLHCMFAVSDWQQQYSNIAILGCT